MRLSLHCKDLTALLSQRQDATASVGNALRVRLHLSACRHCRTVDTQLGFIRQAMRRMAQQKRPASQPGPGHDSAADPP
jgi:predicted anti-sigma-YlaC factor YlaD